MAVFTFSFLPSVLAQTPDEREQQRINKNMEKMLQMQEMLRQQGKLPAQEVDKAPPDDYKGDDKDKIKDFAKKQWIEAFKEDEILAVRIQMDNWERTKEKRYSSDGREYEVDYSSIQALVFIKKDNEHAAIYPLNISKDHLNKDALSADPKADRAGAGMLMQVVPISKM